MFCGYNKTELIYKECLTAVFHFGSDYMSETQHIILLTPHSAVLATPCH